MRVLLVSDLHYELRKLDWLLERAPDHDLVALAGDVLHVASAVPFDTQIAVVLTYLERLAARTTVAVCSGNHDLDSRTGSGEKVSAWLAEARAAGVVVDGDSADVAGWRVTSCAWWEGPVTLAAVEQGLSPPPPGVPWLWLWHGPPDGPLAWDGRRTWGDPELARLVDAHQPSVVLCGHVHQAPFTEDGSWWQRRGTSWLFNAGHERGPVPPAVRLDLAEGTAWWQSSAGREDLTLAGQSR